MAEHRRSHTAEQGGGAARPQRPQRPQIISVVPTDLSLQRLVDRIPPMAAAQLSEETEIAGLTQVLTTPWSAAPVREEDVQTRLAQLAALPAGHAVVVHRRDRQEGRRAAEILAGEGVAAPAHEREKDRKTRQRWQSSLARATASGWAHLEAARAATAADGRLTASVGPAAATPVGYVLAGSYGTQQGNAAAITAALEAHHSGLAPQRQVNQPWMHWVGAYGQKVDRQQMVYDALATMVGSGLQPDDHAWVLFGHGTHWHLVAGRVRRDGMVYQMPNAGIALRATVDVLDAESGVRTEYHAPGQHDKATAIAYRAMERDGLAAELRGRSEDGLARVVEVPLQGPGWARRIAALGHYPHRTPGLLVIQKPSYQAVAGIVRHCIFG